jgi:hypothetical protein
MGKTHAILTIARTVAEHTRRSVDARRFPKMKASTLLIMAAVGLALVF